MLLLPPLLLLPFALLALFLLAITEDDDVAPPTAFEDDIVPLP